MRSAHLQTRIGTQAFSVATAEHLLAACHGLGVWDLEVTLRGGDELPILDGSARPWVEALDALRAAAPPAPPPAPRRVRAPVEVRDGPRHARLEPADGFFVTASLSPRPGLAALGPLSLTLSLTPDSFRRELAWARTWVLAADADRLRAAGFGAGADPTNTVLVGGPSPAPSRGPSEPLRHKILDALGDLALLGRPVLGHLHLHDSGHALHTALALRTLERS